MEYTKKNLQSVVGSFAVPLTPHFWEDRLYFGSNALRRKKYFKRHKSSDRYIEVRRFRNSYLEFAFSWSPFREEKIMWYSRRWQENRCWACWVIIPRSAKEGFAVHCYLIDVIVTRMDFGKVMDGHNKWTPSPLPTYGCSFPWLSDFWSVPPTRLFTSFFSYTLKRYIVLKLSKKAINVKSIHTILQ